MIESEIFIAVTVENTEKWAKTVATAKAKFFFIHSLTSVFNASPNNLSMRKSSIYTTASSSFVCVVSMQLTEFGSALESLVLQ